MIKLLKEVADDLNIQMNNVEKATSYREGVADGYNRSIRDIGTKIREIENLTTKDLYKYIPDEVLNTIDTIKIGGDKCTPIHIQVKSYNPLKYGVMCGRDRMNRNGEFSYEPLGSSRSDKYIEQHSFNSIIEAWDCYDKYHS